MMDTNLNPRVTFVECLYKWNVCGIKKSRDEEEKTENKCVSGIFQMLCKSQCLVSNKRNEDGHVRTPPFICITTDLRLPLMNQKCVFGVQKLRTPIHLRTSCKHFRQIQVHPNLRNNKVLPAKEISPLALYTILCCVKKKAA